MTALLGIRDPWDHLDKFYKRCSICNPNNDITNDQVKLCLFGFSLICRANDWLQRNPNGIIHIWKGREDKFLKRYYSNTQFVERKDVTSIFDQDESESSSDAWERFKLLLRKCLNHNMSVMEQMTRFTSRMKIPTRMILDASTGGTLRSNTNDEVKILIEICARMSIAQVIERWSKRVFCSLFKHKIIISGWCAF